MKVEINFDKWFSENLKAIPSFDDELISLWIDYPCLSNEEEEDENEE